MKKIDSLFATAMLLSVVLTSVQAELCPVSNYNSTTGNVTIPCAMVNELQIALDLEPATPKGAPDNEFYWKLANLDASTCQWAPGSCAILGDLFELSLPFTIDEDGVKFVAGLHFYPGMDGIYWQYDFHDFVDTENVVSLKKGTPNPKGSFESLYTFEGDVANFELDKFYDFQMGEGVVPSQAKLKEGDEIILRIFHFNDLHSDLRTIHSSRGDTHRFSQMVKIVKEAKANAADNEIVLFLSAGDDHIGNPFDELLGFDVNSFQTSAPYTAYSGGGLDASVIGNHELDRGTAILAKAIEQDAKFPVLSANLYGSKNLTSDHYHPAIIGIAKGLRIGIIGLTTKQETLLKTEEEPELDAGDLLKIATLVRRLLPIL
jgi:hypothetical protein